MKLCCLLVPNALRSHRTCAALFISFILFALPLMSASPAWAEDPAPRIDRSTPRRAIAAFLVAAEARDYDSATELLDLSALPPGSRRERGPVLAGQLRRVLEQTGAVQPEKLSDEPGGDPTDGVDQERIGVVSTNDTEIPILLSRSGDGRWSFASSTVARIPHLYDASAPGFIESHAPDALHGRAWGIAGWQWLGLLVALAAAFAIGRAATYVGTQVAGRLARKTVARWDDELVIALRRPTRFFIGSLAFNELARTLALPAGARNVLERMLGIVLIGAVTWALIGVVGVVSRVVERRATRMGDSAHADLRARGVKTQVRVLGRVVNVALVIIATALMLTQFEIVRSIGVSLLASAGVAGLVLGLAAQRTIGGLIAGIQLSFTQPIRIGDVVIVEKEWGTIEEITLTFVVVRVWDERRLVVPMTRFLEHPFENWTKVSAELHGTVFFNVDFRLPVDDVRKELDRIVADDPRWDGRTKSVCVTNATERTLEIRALVSAANAGDLWDLRVAVREKVIAWLQKHEGGRYLPQLRLEETASRRQRDGEGLRARG